MLTCVLHIKPLSNLKENKIFSITTIMSSKLPSFPTEYLELTFLEETADAKEYAKQQNRRILPFAISEVIIAPVLSAKNITQGDDVKKVIEICMNIEGSDLNYKPGYTFGIIPENNISEVNKIIERLKYNEIADKLFTVSVTNSKKKIPPHIPAIGTIREILLHNLCIRSIPKKLFLRALTKYTTNEDEINKLNELCQVSSAAYSKFITVEYLGLLDLLNIFPSSFPPFTVLLEHLPRLLPRPYSVTCSPVNFDPPCTQIHFIYSTTLNGVCTGWLNKRITDFENGENVSIPLYLRKPNNFILPERSDANLILIATGTGIAPFLSFLRHKNIIREVCGSIWLFYGCRYPDRDFLYKDEIEKFVENGVLTKLFTSFSRAPQNNIRYVQDHIVLNSREIIKILDDNAIIYVCGNKNMSNSVFEMITNCIHDVKQTSMEEATNIVNELRKNNKYIEDVWN